MLALPFLPAVSQARLGASAVLVLPSGEASLMARSLSYDALSRSVSSYTATSKEKLQVGVGASLFTVLLLVACSPSVMAEATTMLLEASAGARVQRSVSIDGRERIVPCNK
jgi:hypothetical protein